MELVNPLLVTQVNFNFLISGTGWCMGIKKARKQWSRRSPRREVMHTSPRTNKRLSLLTFCRYERFNSPFVLRFVVKYLMKTSALRFPPVFSS